MSQLDVSNAHRAGGKTEGNTPKTSSSTLASAPGSEITAVNASHSVSTAINRSTENSNDRISGSYDRDSQDNEKNENVDVSEPPPPYRDSRYQPPQPYRYEKLCQKTPGLMDHPSMTFGGPMIILFDIVVPCVIYYTWYNKQVADWERHCNPFTSRQESCPDPKPEFDQHVLGLAVISFGFGELYILLARVYRLWTYRDECAPLLSRRRWELDATSWVYLAAMVFALIPFVVGSTMVIPTLYLYSPAFLMAFLGIFMIVSLFPIPLVIRINSHQRGGTIRPFIYYAAEDFIAVDGLQGRDFRVRFNARYENSPAFRRLFILLTIWWIIGIVVYILCLTAVIWTMSFHYAFGLSLGILFAYIATWALTSYIFVSIENKIEFQRAKEAGILHPDYVE